MNNDIKPNLNFDNETEEVEKDILLASAISYWISKKGILDLDTDEKQIIKFYNERIRKLDS